MVLTAVKGKPIMSKKRALYLKSRRRVLPESSESNGVEPVKPRKVPVRFPHVPMNTTRPKVELITLNHYLAWHEYIERVVNETIERFERFRAERLEQEQQLQCSAPAAGG